MYGRGFERGPVIVRGALLEVPVRGAVVELIVVKCESIYNIH